MMIHIWMHWFWITPLCHQVLLLFLTFQFISSSVLSIPLHDGSRYPHPQTYQALARVRRVPPLPSPSPSPTPSPSPSPSPYPFPSSSTTSYPQPSDVDDTFNGDDDDSSAFLPFPPKKYQGKTYEKYKSTKVRMEEDVENVTSTTENVTSSTTEDAWTSSMLSEVEEELEEVSEESPTTLEPFIFSNKMAAAATSAEDKERMTGGSLDAGSITGIALGIVVIAGLFGATSFVLYRRRYLNKPQVLNDKSSNLDSSGYIDDSSLRENSEEMYSLDNDSFLNSLEAMTIQNYWTESVKHTKL